MVWTETGRVTASGIARSGMSRLATRMTGVSAGEELGKMTIRMAPGGRGGA